MGIADKLRKQRTDMFEQEFDIEQFEGYIIKYFSKYNNLEIGICSDWTFDNYLHNKKQSYQIKGQEFLKPNSFCKWIAYADSHECYVWCTNIQIPQKFANNVVDYLQKNGFKCTQKGACGYNTYDVICVKL